MRCTGKRLGAKWYPPKTTTLGTKIPHTDPSQELWNLATNSCSSCRFCPRPTGMTVDLHTRSSGHPFFSVPSREKSFAPDAVARNQVSKSNERRRKWSCGTPKRRLPSMRQRRGLWTVRACAMESGASDSVTTNPTANQSWPSPTLCR